MKPELRNRFQKRAQAIARMKKDARFLRVVGKLKRHQFLVAPSVPGFAGPVELEDALWAGTVEPRVLEVLPAVLLSRPKLFRVRQIPEDLKTVLRALRGGERAAPFRGIPFEKYRQWVLQEPSQLKTFRMKASDIELLRRLRHELQAKSDLDVLRRGLHQLSKRER